MLSDANLPFKKDCDELAVNLSSLLTKTLANSFSSVVVRDIGL